VSAAGNQDRAGLAYLLGRVGLVEDRIRVLVQHRRADDPAPDDPFRGLYVTDEVVEKLLAPAAAPPRADGAAREQIETQADAAEADGARIRLRRLAAEAGLTALDTEILVIALVPDLDSRFERLYGYLNDDVTRRWRWPTRPRRRRRPGPGCCPGGRWSTDRWSCSTTPTGRS
jgi:hypothetical protein